MQLSRLELYQNLLVIMPLLSYCRLFAPLTHHLWRFMLLRGEDTRQMELDTRQMKLIFSSQLSTRDWDHMLHSSV